MENRKKYFFCIMGTKRVGNQIVKYILTVCIKVPKE